ncbi:MAG: deoxyribonuclease IV [Syntrophomonadaceae bacterium]|nr:deoxyribonuclease IV [Syntrophomonadaceae bacterium]MDD3890523.1 deoxyribonuclease IV [Syntrophomonadaceae bacterium]
MPIGKGLKNTADEAVSKELEALQMFLRNPRGRGARQFTADEINYFNDIIKKKDIYPVVVHIPYICNPASFKEDLYAFALEILQHDLSRCVLVNADFIVLHPGSYTSSTLEEGIDRIANLLNIVLNDYTGETCILLETMAGQGSEIGRNFEEINLIMQKIKNTDKLGVCFDTCHTFAAGYDSTVIEGLNGILNAMDSTFGREKVKIVHANDSSKELGSRRDRHAHIGQGFIGIDGFTNIMSHQFFKGLPFILETPFEGIEADIKLLKQIRDKNS